MDIIRLRTMTWKSRFTEGKYKGLTVEQVYNIGAGKLAYIYFSESKITFIDEILDAIKIFESERIEKPGKDLDALAMRYRRIAYSKGGKRELFRRIAIQRAYDRRRAKARYMNALYDECRSKANLQWANQH